MTMSRCGRCGSQAKVLLPHFSLALCDACFKSFVVERVREEVKRHDMFSTSHTLLLGVSGGKDSFVLLDVLATLHDPGKLVALTIIEGIEGYNRSEEVQFIRRAAAERGVEHVVTSFKERIGASLRELMASAGVLGASVSPCTFCGVVRRRILNDFAREVGAARVVTAHNLDDEVQTAVMNLIRGRPIELVKLHPAVPVPSERLVKRVKPLRKVYEWEVAYYAYRTGYRFQEIECPFISAQPTLRARLRRWLMVLETEKPGALLRFLERLDVLLQPAVGKVGETVTLGTCRLCGGPTSPSRSLCKFCELLSYVGRSMA